MPSATYSTVQVGTYYSPTDLFTQVLDLNDRATYYVRAGGIKIDQPKKVMVRASNVRTPGETVSKFQYQNRHVQVEINLRSATTAGLIAAVRALIQAIERPPYVLRLATANATQYSYADVVAVTHNIPMNAQQILAGAVLKVQIDFECQPGFRGDRLWLQNRVANPGFEAPSTGYGVQVFSDTFANVDAYTVTAGTAPTVTANVMTIPAGTTVQFGSVQWEAVNNWQIRFQFATGMTVGFDPHGSAGNANNLLNIGLSGTTVNLTHTVGGTAHTLATATIALTNGNWYWLQFTHFPAGWPTGGIYGAIMQVTLANDNAGAVGTTVATLGQVPAYDAVTDMIGAPQIAVAGAAMAVGGNYNNVHIVKLFGPGDWTFVNDTGHTGMTSGAWDASQSTLANLWTSEFAVRIDCGPSGTVQGTWQNYGGGGSPPGTAAIPVTPGNTQYMSVWYRSTGLSGTARIQLITTEYSNTGAYLRSQEYFQDTDTGGAWKNHTESWVGGTNAAYLGVALRVEDGTAGASAGATVWFDNVSSWDATQTGQTAMPYCELRNMLAPAQFMVSGVIGDMPAPALLMVGSTPNLAAAGKLNIIIGRRLTPGWRAKLVRAAVVYNPSAVNNITALDSTAYAGYRVAYAGASGNYEPMFTSGNVFDYLGQFHLFTRAQVLDGSPTTQAVTPLNYSELGKYVPLQTATTSPRLGLYEGAAVTPFPDNTAFHVFDMGYVPSPPFAITALTDPSQTQETFAFLGTTESTGMYVDWGVAMPEDGEILVLQFINQTAGPPLNYWLWFYADGQVGTVNWSSEIDAIANPIHSGGGAGAGSIAPAINSFGDGVPYVDPLAATLYSPTAVPQAGVQQYGVLVYDNTNTMQPVAMDVVYSPRYLWPR